MERMVRINEVHAYRLTAPGHSPVSSPLRSSPLSNPPIYAHAHANEHADRRVPSSSLYSTSRTKARTIPRRTSQPNRPRATLSPILPLPLDPSSPPDHNDTDGTNPNAMTPSPPLSRSHPLLGSYSLSLIHSRMSHAHQPHSSSTFSIHIKAVGQGKRCPPELRCPKPLDLPLPATYYDLEDPSGSHGLNRGGANQSPWVGTVDLESHYYDLYAPTSVFTSSSSSNKADNGYTGIGPGMGVPTGAMGNGAGMELRDPPDHPGFPVAPVGQLQMIVKTPTNALKAFLVPYDLRSLPIGGRLLARERTYGQTTVPSPPSSCKPGPGSPSSSRTNEQKRSLRYAYQLQFVCLPVTLPLSRSSSPDRVRSSSTNRHTSSYSSYTTSIGAEAPYGKVEGREEGGEPERAYYLSKSLRIIFTSNPPDFESLSSERTDEVVPPSSGIQVSGDRVKQGQRRRSSGFGFGSGPASPGSGRGVGEWELVRLKWMARRDMENRAGTITEPDSGPLYDHDSDGAKNSGSPSRPLSRALPVSTIHSRQSITSTNLREPEPESTPTPTPTGTASAYLPPLPLRPPVRASTPIPQPFTLPSTALPPVKVPSSPRYGRRVLRRGSTEERELSEKLRKMGSE